MNKLAILFALVLTACTAGSPGTSDAASSSSMGEAGGIAVSSRPLSSSARTSSLVSSGVSSFRQSSSSRSKVALRRISVVATADSFAPKIITAAKGERVQLLVSGTEGPFGFVIPQLRIQEQVVPLRSTAIDVPTDLAGSFEFRCSAPCGTLHEGMSGQIIIR